MGYLEKILEPGEEVRYIGRLYWLIYLPAIAFVICAAALLVAAAIYPNLAPYLVAGGLVALGLSVFAFIPELLRRRTTEIAVTDRRVIFKTGVLRRRSIEMNLDKVESVDVDQSILGRMFDFCTVLIRGTGASLEPLYQIQDPLRLRSQITAH